MLKAGHIAALCGSILLLISFAAQASPSVDLASTILTHDFTVMKSSGESGVRSEIISCYKKLSNYSSIDRVEYCYMLDFLSSTIDEGVRANLGMAEDPTGFHNYADLISRVSKAFSRMHIDKSNAKALILEWTVAAQEAAKETSK